MCDRTALAAEARARRAARRVVLVARKSRWRAGSIDNYNGFMLVDPETNGAVDGTRFDLSAEYMIDYCRGLEADEQAAHPEPTQHSAIEDVRREEPTRINFKVEDVQREGRLKIIVGGRQ